MKQVDCVRIPKDYWERLLYERFADWADTRKEIPEFLMDWAVEYFGDIAGALPDPGMMRPDYLVDNFVIGGDWGMWENYKRAPEETQDEVMERMEARALQMFPEEGWIVVTIGF